MSNQSYYVPDSSRLPIFMAFSLFLLVMGASSTINNLGEEGSKSSYILYAGFIGLFATMFVEEFLESRRHAVEASKRWQRSSIWRSHYRCYSTTR